MSKLTEWLRSLVGLTKVDEDAIVADGEAAISRVFERLGDHLETEMAAFQDRLAAKVHVTLGTTAGSPPPTRKQRIADLVEEFSHEDLVDEADARHLLNRGQLARKTKTQLATLIVGAK